MPLNRIIWAPPPPPPPWRTLCEKLLIFFGITTFVVSFCMLIYTTPDPYYFDLWVLLPTQMAQQMDTLMHEIRTRDIKIKWLAPPSPIVSTTSYGLCRALIEVCIYMPHRAVWILERLFTGQLGDVAVWVARMVLCFGVALNTNQYRPPSLDDFLVPLYTRPDSPDWTAKCREAAPRLHARVCICPLTNVTQ